MDAALLWWNTIKPLLTTTTEVVITAKVHSYLKSTTCKERAPLPTERFYIVNYTANGGFSNPRPQLTIKGRWLEQTDFYDEQPVVIKVEHNKLIIEFAMQIKELKNKLPTS